MIKHGFTDQEESERKRLKRAGSGFPPVLWLLLEPPPSPALRSHQLPPASHLTDRGGSIGILIYGGRNRGQTREGAGLGLRPCPVRI